MLEAEAVDVVSGWRVDRKDGFVRSLLSRIANRLISAATGVRLHDYGCSLKAYRRDVLEQVRLYGELHRFLPALLADVGAAVREVAVNHRPRLSGRSKYSLDRSTRVLLDLLLVMFLHRYVQRPLHVFGGIGLVFAVTGMAICLYLTGLKVFYGESIGGRPLLLLGITLNIVALFLIIQGLLGELIIRLLHESTDRPQYRLKLLRKLRRGEVPLQPVAEAIGEINTQQDSRISHQTKQSSPAPGI
jgi:glycosyltransferase involved in cell wall biosynthesis